MRTFDPFGAMAVGCLVIVAFIEAAQQALNGAPSVAAALPTLATSPKVNYAPLALLIVAGLLWIIKCARLRYQGTSPTPLPDDEVDAFQKSIHELEGKQLEPGISIANSTLNDVTIIQQSAPTAVRLGEIYYQANVDLRIKKTFSVTLEAKLTTLGATANANISASAPVEIKKVGLVAETTVKESEDGKK